MKRSFLPDIPESRELAYFVMLKKIILGIFGLRLSFSQALISDKKPRFRTDTNYMVNLISSEYHVISRPISIRQFHSSPSRHHGGEGCI